MNELNLAVYLLKRIPDLQFQDDQFSSFDCISNNKKLFIELKCRNTHYDELILEKAKYDAIRSKAAKYGYGAWYINSTPKGVWAFNLSKLQEIKWVEKQLPATTEFENRGHVSKHITYLNIEDGYPI